MTTSVALVPNATTRDGRSLVPQIHGGALAPYPAGHAITGAFKKVRRDALSVLREGTVEASRRLMELPRSPDERVAVIAITQVLGRTLGRPNDMPQGGDFDTSPLDVSLLDAGERDELMAHLAGIRRLRSVITNRMAAQGRG